MSNKRKLIIAAAVIFAAAAVCLLIILKINGYFLPGWISWQERDVIWTTGKAEKGFPAKAVLKNRRVRVLDTKGNILWESERTVKVQDILAADIDRDGQDELLLLCWKRGRYGTSRPFWVTEDEKNWSQHIFIYEWKETRVGASWMASDIGMDAASWSFDPETRLSITETDGRVTRWDWFSFGLEYIGEF